MVVELRVQEQQLLSVLSKQEGSASVEQLVQFCGFPDAAVMRNALSLQERNLLTIQAATQNIIKLTTEGKSYAQTCLPERKLILAVAELGGKADLYEAAKKADLEGSFIQIAQGWVIRKKWAFYDSKTNTLTLNDALMHQMTVPEGCDEALLKYLGEKDQASFDDLSDELKDASEQLKKRKLAVVEPKTTRILKITPEGICAVSEASIAVPEVTKLTPELIITGKWREAKLQKYNIEAPVAKTWGGKKHPYLSFLDEVRAKLVQLGFQEMTGTAVEASFFNFDALYVPQDHPARDPSDIYYIKDPKYANLDNQTQTVEQIAQTHQNGNQTGSTGWGYKYSLEAAQRLILRGHGTCLSARTLQSGKYQVPSRHFSIARVYRPEITDRTHLSEFNQVEGIIIDEHLTLKDLLGVLGKFALEIAGADKIRFKPDYFPFTEPSVELSAYKEGYGWIEFGGSGIFRPEVTIPLNVKAPVIAWGLGVDRLYMMRNEISDIRMIFNQDLDWLRKKQVT
ncbi:phenylalanine--tRNA ligase subunit alpha [Candidatus Bathycorpusculum sp.]|uniref:phenylalanine--tRNA ligase subunit alpha n=1 Tax=Candidatus Bathycorpusculum sp. TaxID=2994959 RepID=UPI002816E029|nr:phenylalanine--tRNA ligase subunit alpha [Candidatus Termitimicrobium sp.]MCL2686842.1 phenylalanine--tRNA ligase subunit alpha [Candidatus Termitimicrobium sp.]